MSRSELIAALHALEPALRELESTIRSQGEGGVGTGGDGEFVLQAGKVEQPGGGKAVATPSKGQAGAAEDPAGGIFAAARSNPVVTGLAAVAAAGVGAGFASAARGGDFSAGALSEVNRLVGAIPFLGEASGISQSVRVEQGVKGVADQIAEVEARGGVITDEERSFFLAESFEIEGRRQESTRASAREIERQTEAGAAGPRATAEDIALSILGLGALKQSLKALGIEVFK